MFCFYAEIIPNFITHKKDSDSVCDDLVSAGPFVTKIVAMVM